MDSGQMDELAALLAEKAVTLDGMAPRYATTSPTEQARLTGKAEGVRLALSFLEEYRRGAR